MSRKHSIVREVLGMSREHSIGREVLGMSREHMLELCAWSSEVACVRT